MIKREELTDPKSCMNRAADGEMTFVLLGRDSAAPFAIRAWISERVRSGKNRSDDEQILEAEHCARYMDQQRLDRIGLACAPVQEAGEAKPPICPECSKPVSYEAGNLFGNCDACKTSWPLRGYHAPAPAPSPAAQTEPSRDSLVALLREIKSYADVSDGECDWDHASTFAKINVKITSALEHEPE